MGDRFQLWAQLLAINHIRVSTLAADFYRIWQNTKKPFFGDNKVLRGGRYSLKYECRGFYLRADPPTLNSLDWMLVHRDIFIHTGG